MDYLKWVKLMKMILIVKNILKNQKIIRFSLANLLKYLIKMKLMINYNQLNNK